ncbi:hypothetical protein HK100_000779 [Physocladia obscura]|uniref:Carboxypeptidase n=1 Tax=Physocladia obscura TaxID=109957 RepID=A0AAD5XGP2_9FUNG|nr:hypothetical protein HK100_000779 [Physocladia obscura]
MHPLVVIFAVGNCLLLGLFAYYPVLSAREIFQASSLASAILEARDYLVDYRKLPWAKGVQPVTESYAGLITVRCEFSSFPDGWTTTNVNASIDLQAQLFFWYFPALNYVGTESPPLIIWLQGGGYSVNFSHKIYFDVCDTIGPGSSSNIGLFYEMGPLRVHPDLTLSLNNETWASQASMIFIDNPVGTGYSNVDKSSTSTSYPTKTQYSHESYKDGYVADQTAVGRDLLTFLHEFYRLFPKNQRAKLFITGESYAGKYVPAFADAVINYNAGLGPAPTTNFIPLHGIAIGNGLTDPVSQILSHAPLALAMGLVSPRQAEILHAHALNAIDFAEKQKWRNATFARDAIFAAFKEFSGGINPYDIRKGSIQNSWSSMETLLNLPSVKRALNVPSQIGFDKDEKVTQNLYTDGMKSMKNVVSKLLSVRQYNFNGSNEIPLSVLLYQGQFDFRDGILSSNKWISSLEWTGSDGYNKANRSVWKIGDAVVGYITSYAQLKRVEVLLAGHLSPQDAPAVTKQMIYDFIFNPVSQPQARKI